MKNYECEDICPKCNHITLTERFVYGTLFGGQNAESEDHIRRRCSNCGYEWNVKTFDATHNL